MLVIFFQSRSEKSRLFIPIRMKYYKLRISQKSHSDSPDYIYHTYASYHDDITIEEIYKTYDPGRECLLMNVSEMSESEFRSHFNDMLN